MEEEILPVCRELMARWTAVELDGVGRLSCLIDHLLNSRSAGAHRARRAPAFAFRRSRRLTRYNLKGRSPPEQSSLRVSCRPAEVGHSRRGTLPPGYIR